MGKAVDTGTQDLTKSLGELEAAADQLDQATGADVQKSQQAQASQDDDLAKSKKAEGDKGEGAAKAGEISEDDGDDTGKDGGDGDGDDDSDDEDMGKSVKASMEENEDVKKALEVSDFLLALTEATSDAIEGIKKSVNESISGQNQISGVMVKSINALAKAQTSIIKSIGDINKSLSDIAERMDAVERTPMTRKSVGAAGVKVVERPLAKSVGNDGAGDGAGATLSKSEIAARLSDMLVKGEPGITTMDVLSFESGAELRPEVKMKLGMS